MACCKRNIYLPCIYLLGVVPWGIFIGFGDAWVLSRAIEILTIMDQARFIRFSTLTLSSVQCFCPEDALVSYCRLRPIAQMMYEPILEISVKIVIVDGDFNWPLRSQICMSAELLWHAKLWTDLTIIFHVKAIMLLQALDNELMTGL